MKLRVAASKIAVTTEVSRNVDALCRAIDAAAAAGADILLTPEGSLSGYTHEFDRAVVRGRLDEVIALARDRGVGLALATCFAEDDGRCYNQVRFYRPDGEYLGFHSKTLTCGSLDTPSTGEIEHFVTSPLRVFAWDGDLTVGALICNDLWAYPACTPMPDPHLSRQLAAMGARVVFHAVNGGRDGSEWSEVTWRYHDANLRLRAAAGRVWIVTVDSSFPTDLPSSAPSGVVAPDGSWACQANPTGEDLFVHTIDLDA